MDPFEQAKSQSGPRSLRKPTGLRDQLLLLSGLFAGAWIWERTHAHLSSQGYQVITSSDPFALLNLGVTPGIQIDFYGRDV